MANRKDFYFRQRVLEGEMDDAFDDVENADRQLARDIGSQQTADTAGVPISDIVTEPDDFNAIRGGINSGFIISFAGGIPSGGNPQPIIGVRVSAGSATDWQGRRVSTPTDLIVDVTSEGDAPVGEGGSTVGGAVVTPPAGQTRIVTLMVLFDRVLTDERVDGNAGTVLYNQAESFVFRAKAGNASVGTPTPPQGDADGIILVDLRVTEFNTVTSWDFSRRGDWIRTSVGVVGDIASTSQMQTGTLNNTGTDFIVPNARQAILRLLRSYAATVTDISAHVDNVNPSSTHTAANIDFKVPGSNWLDGSSLAARLPGGGNTDGVQGAFRELIDDLAASALNSDGAGRMGAMAQIAGPVAYAGNARYNVSAGSIRSQIKTLLDSIEQQVMDVTVGDGVATYGMFNTSDFAGDWGATLQAAITSVPSGGSVRVYILNPGTLNGSTACVTGNRNVFLHARPGTILNITANVIGFRATGASAFVHVENLTIRNLTTPTQTSVEFAGLFSARKCNFANGVLGTTAASRSVFEDCTLGGRTNILRGAFINASFLNCDFELSGPNNNDALWDGSDGAADVLINAQFTRCQFSAKNDVTPTFFTYFRFSDFDENITFDSCSFNDAANATTAGASERNFAGTAPRNITYRGCRIDTRGGVFNAAGGGVKVTIADCDITLAGSGSQTVFLLPASQTATDIDIKDNRVLQTDFNNTKRLVYTLVNATIERLSITGNKCVDLDTFFEFTKAMEVNISRNVMVNTTTGRGKNFIKTHSTWAVRNFSVTDNTVKGLQFNSTNQRAIDMQSGTFEDLSLRQNVHIANNRFEDIGTALGGGTTDNAYAIDINASLSHLQITGNTIRTVQSNNEAVGIRVIIAGNVVIHGNTITSVGDEFNCAATIPAAIVLFGCLRVRCTDNIGYSIGHAGTLAATGLYWAGDATSTDVVVHGNSFTNLSGVGPYGIYAAGSTKRLNIQGNTIGVLPELGTGIDLTDSSTDGTSQVNISQNNITGGDTGIAVFVGNGAAPANSYGRYTINSNTISTFKINGIALTGGASSPTWTVQGNTIYTHLSGSGMRGIVGTTLHRAVISGNTIEFTTGGTTTNLMGIRLTGTGSEINVNGNTIALTGSSTGRKGVYVHADSQMVIVTGNLVFSLSPLGVVGIHLHDGFSGGGTLQWAASNMINVDLSGVAFQDDAVGNNSSSPMDTAGANPGVTPAALSSIDLNWRRGTHV